MKYISTLTYILLIVGINIGYTITPFFMVFGRELSLMDPLAGVVYLLRDFAQRELGHRVLVAMAMGIGLSYVMATPAVAKASVCAFALGELLDWVIFTFSGKPLSQRLLWSSLISAPVDSWVFLALLDHLNGLSLLVMTLGKIAGVFLLWSLWRIQSQQKLIANPA
jgi:queuosine precursor transporter